MPPTYLGHTLIAAHADLDNLGYVVPAGGRTTSALPAYLLNDAVYNVRDFGAVGDAVTDDTAAFQLAIDTANAAKRASVYVPDGIYSIAGTIILKRGVCLYGNAGTAEYYPGFDGLDGLNESFGATLRKLAGGTAGPIVEMAWTSAIKGLTLDHRKVNGATTGIIRVGATAATTIITQAHVIDVCILGTRTTDTAGVTTCYGIFFPDSQSGKARYFNQFSRVSIVECDVAVHLGGQSNANIFTNMMTRECHVHYDLDAGPTGGNVVLENVFTGLGMFAVNNPVLAPAPICFRLVRGAKKNAFIGYSNENAGQTFAISTLSSDNNRFLGTSNESVVSTVVPGCIDFSYAQAAGIDGYRSLLGINATAATLLIFGAGNKLTFFKKITGTLPNINEATGAILAGQSNNRRIIVFPSLYKKSANITVRGKITVYAYSPANHGMHWVEVEFIYRNINAATNAGSFRVISSIGSLLMASAGGLNEISGLWFISGKTDNTPFKIVLVGGNYAASAFDQIFVSLDLDALSYSSNTLDMAALATLGFDTDITVANDVTDAIDMALVATTAV